MAYQLTSVNQMYTDAVNAIKTIKMSNMRMTKDCSPEQEHMVVVQARAQIEKWIQTMDKNYMQPRTAHRLEIMKEQLKNQWAKHQSYLKMYEDEARKQKETLDQSENNNQEFMNDLEFDYEHEKYLMKQKTHQLKEAHSKLEKINSVVLETQTMTFDQGEQLDMIGQNMSGSLINVQESNSYLAEANKEQQKGQSKYACLLIVCGVVLVLIAGSFFVFG